MTCAMALTQAKYKTVEQNTQWGKDSLFLMTVPGKLDGHTQKNETELYVTLWTMSTQNELNT